MSAREAHLSYRRHDSFHESLRGTKSMESRGGPPGRLDQRSGTEHYGSDPTLLNNSEVENEGQSSGRRSALDLDHYSPRGLDHYSPRLNDDQAVEAKRVKKKKLKKLRSFMHVFIGGLRGQSSTQHNSSNTEHQSKEQDNLINPKHQGRQNHSTHYSPTPCSPDLKEDHYSGLGGSPQRQSSVPPSSSALACRGAEVPGLCGLHNHGNTCFMNAIVQCLSNTDQLAEYMVTDYYKNDINRHKLSARNFSSRGEITEQFAIMLKCLWNGQYDPRVTGRFKEVIGRYASQYQGSSQHDAQEFFLWLLDSVHEDLNLGGKRKYRPLKDSAGRPDEVVAAEYLNSHMKRNNSFIQNLFQGQFRSAVTCPSCNNQSLTFDPYVCISLPLPQRDKRPIYVTVVYRSNSRTSKVFGVDMHIDSSIRELRNALAELCGINRYHMVLTDLLPTGFNRTFYDDQHLSVINSGDLIFAFECPPYRGDNPEAISQVNPSGSKELMLVLVVNKLGLTQYGKRFGSPLILRVWRDLTHMQFQSVVLKAMVRYLREGMHLTEVCRSGRLFQCRVVDGLPGRSILPDDAEHPLYSPSIDKALHVSMLYGGPAHIKLIAEWEPSCKAQVFGVVPESIPEPHQSVQELRDAYQQPLTAGLQDCLNIYTKEETLNREDSWFCPHCKHQQQDATKKITLWTLPDVLVIHLKRFRHTGYCRTKLNSLVTFPIQSLDMTHYLAPRSTRHPSSATLQRRMQTTARTKAVSPASKSVRFDESSAPKTNRNLSGKEKRFHFLRRKKKDEDTSHKRSDGTFSPGVCDSPSSIRSAPSTVGHSTARGRRVHSPVLSLDGGDLRPRSPASGDVSADNMYTLYAVCNHQGTMTRGHYTAYCRNPTDGQWYMFDDSHVQAMSEDQLVTAGAYLLFYVRQSLINIVPPLSSASSSSSSSGGSSHWAMHIPRFRLDLGSASDGAQSPNNQNDNRTARPRLGSAGSSTATHSMRGLSPPSLAQDNESDVFVRGAADNTGGPGVLSSTGGPGVPSSTGAQSHMAHGRSSSLHHHQASPAPDHKHHQLSDIHHRSYSVSSSKPQQQSQPMVAVASGLGGRHASLRLGRQRHCSPDSVPITSEQLYRRGTSFHGTHQYRDTVRRTVTDSGRLMDMPVHPAYPGSGQVLALPSRSIPNMSTTEHGWNDQDTPLAVPCRSTPDIATGMPTTPGPRPVQPQHNYTMHYTPQPSRPRHASTRSYSISHGNSGTESCV